MKLYETYKFNNKFLLEFQKLFSKEYNFFESLDNIHTLLNSVKISDSDKIYHSHIQILGKNDRNSKFIKDYHNYVDNFSSFNETYYQFINEYVKPMFPNEQKLVIQKTPNLRISFPNLTAIGKNENETRDIIGLHKDSDFGHHFSEINFIIPITKMFDTNSVYFEPEINSNVSFENYKTLQLETDEFFVGKLNQLKHYNKMNQTEKTRISLDLRIIPFSFYQEYIKDFKDTKFELGKYYITI
jgi:hypothetical protein